jgi:hypothetical protein
MSNIQQAAGQSLAATTDTQRAAQNLTDLADRLDRVSALYLVSTG